MKASYHGVDRVATGAENTARKRGEFDILISISRSETDHRREKPVHGEQKMKAIVTVVGKDSVGIIAGVCQILAEFGINILDISQTIMQGYFTMMMIVDLDGSAIPFMELSETLSEYGKSRGLSIRIQREDTFDAMNQL